ncbi:histone protein [Streptomyces sp. NPDC019443]|uniref:histone protein n=1 Tax=Streptomyces sp. NPDC019443 TaxID=3365061 RepID=UPI00378B9C59
MATVALDSEKANNNMSDSKSIALAAAVAGGYALGRTKKGRVAFTAAAVLLGRGLTPRNLVAGGIRRIGGGPGDEEGGAKPQREIGQTVRKAVSEAANRRLTSLTEALHEHTVALSGEEERDKDAAADTDEPEEADVEEAADETGDQSGEETAEEEPAKPSRQRPPAKKTAAQKKAPQKRTAPRKQGTAERWTTAKSAARKSPPAEKTAAKKSQPARKSSSRPGRER